MFGGLFSFGHTDEGLFPVPVSSVSCPRPPPQARSQREVRFTIIPAFSQEETPPNKPKVTSRSEWKRVTSASCPLCLWLP